MGWSGHVARMAEGRGAQGVGGETRGNRTLGRPKSSWNGNINMDHQEFNVVVGNVLSWFRIGTGGRHL
jgi:hypothetical protein